jgi:hypothetical protein
MLSRSQVIARQTAAPEGLQPVTNKKSEFAEAADQPKGEKEGCKPSSELVN